MFRNRIKKSACFQGTGEAERRKIGRNEDVTEEPTHGHHFLKTIDGTSSGFRMFREPNAWSTFRV